MATIKSTAPREPGVRNFDNIRITQLGLSAERGGFVIGVSGFVRGYRFDGSGVFTLADLRKLYKALGVTIAEAEGTA